MIKLKADFLNENCHCTTLDTQTLPPYFSAAPHFLSQKHLGAIQEFITTYEAQLKNPAVAQYFLSDYPAGFSRSRIEQGIFNSYDFHISPAGPRLIEINSNAGGAMLSLLASENIRRCCDSMDEYLPKAGGKFEREKLLQMFRDEFHLRFPERELRRVAIIDESPEAQFFYKEFQLTREFLESHSIEAVIAGPDELSIANDRALVKGQPVDFIYNRMTDFYFESPQAPALREIFIRGLATVSPNPMVHALYARKSNLVAFWQDEFITQMGMDQETSRLLRSVIPRTVFVTPGNLDELWQGRKGWFFKPVNGFGSKGVYRGDKLTKRVWEHIAGGGYIAQVYIEPTERKISATDKFKYDLRVYTYGAEILGIAARYYQGQATNFRTAGGGLATVLIAA